MEYASRHESNTAPIGIALMDPQAEIIRLKGPTKRKIKPTANPAAKPSATSARAIKPASAKRPAREKSDAASGSAKPRARRTPAAKTQTRSRKAAASAAPVALKALDTGVAPCAEERSHDHATADAMMPVPAARQSVSPENTVFVSLCFEGPDHYATAGGLGTRIAAMTETLATQGYETHLIYVGDPGLPPVERRVDGRLHLKRWCQAVSRQYRHGVYDGEDHKVYDYTESVARHVCHDITEPAVAAGKLVIIIAEDWHTAEAISRVSDLLHERGLRQRAILLWNCNSLMSLHRIDFARLSFTSTITTVSRYMKHRLWDYGVNPLVIPNGIPARYLDPVDQVYVDQLRELLRRGDPNRLILFKVARFDPDKRWMMAIEAAARLKQSGYSLAFLLRGGIEPHGAEVLARARELGLRVRDVEAGGGGIVEFLGALRAAGPADLYNLRFYVPPEIGRVCYAAADATLANSGHEPFGLVGLEVMAAGGVAVTGSTGEDYAEALGNALVLETDDPDELVGALEHLVRRPAERERIRIAGRRTAAAYVWDQAIEHLTDKVSYLMRKQGIVLG